MAQLLVGVVVLQMGVMAISGPPVKSEVLTWNQLVNLAQNRRLQEGSLLPRLSLSQAGGAPYTPKFPATIVFRGSCSCQDVPVAAWMDAANRSHETAALVCVDSTMSLDKAKWLAKPSQVVARSRVADVDPIVSAPQKLPLAVHVDARGIITSIEGVSE